MKKNWVSEKGIFEYWYQYTPYRTKSTSGKMYGINWSISRFKEATLDFYVYQKRNSKSLDWKKVYSTTLQEPFRLTSHSVHLSKLVAQLLNLTADELDVFAIPIIRDFVQDHKYPKGTLKVLCSTYYRKDTNPTST